MKTTIAPEPLTERHIAVIEEEIAKWATAASELHAEADRISADDCPRAKAFTSGQATAYGHVAEFLKLARFSEVLAEVAEARALRQRADDIAATWEQPFVALGELDQDADGYNAAEIKQFNHCAKALRAALTPAGEKDGA